MRKLASIQKITKLEPIEGADKIKKATVLGWSVVVQASEFKEGDTVVYVEIDSIMPPKPEFEFLKDRKYRIRTIKLRGQISQGICFPLSILPKKNWNEGDDVTEIIGVKKYDSQAELERKETERLAQIDKNRLKKFMMKYGWFRRIIYRPSKLPFPAFIKKTDEDRIQLFPNICEVHKDTVFTVTEKLDGQSMTLFVIKNPLKWQFWKPYVFGVCSRNFQILKDDGQSYWKMAQKLDAKRKMIAFCKSRMMDRLIIQGEVCGTKIQGNKYKLSENDYWVFNVIVDKLTLDASAQTNVCYTLGFKTVMILDTNFKLKPTIRENVEFAKGYSLLNPQTLREGVVVRNYDKNVSFKIINTDFLLNYEE